MIRHIVITPSLLFLVSFSLLTVQTVNSAGATGFAAGLSPEEETPAEGQTPISYYRKVRPIFQRRCSGCHFAGKREGKLSVVNVTDILTGGESGPGIVPGKPDDSVVIAYISGDEPEMPLNAEPLSEQEVFLIRRWIEQGAVDDTPPSVGTEISAEHPPVYRTPPVVTSLDYSPDGTLLAVTGYHEVLLHSLDQPGSPRRLIGRSPRIESVSFSPDGTILAAVGGSPSLFGELQLWSVADGKLLHSVTISHDTLFGVTFNSKGTLVAFGGADKSLRVVDVASGEIRMQMDAHADWVHGSAFSLAEDHLISVSRDRSMKLTIVANGQFVDNITSITPGALKGGLVDVQRHPAKEEVLAAGSDGQPRLYRIFRVQARQIGDDFNLIRSYSAMPGRICDLDMSTSGAKFVCGSSTAIGGAARIYVTDDAAKFTDLAGIESPAFAVSFRPDEKQVAVSGFDGVIRLYNAETGQAEAAFPAAPLSEGIPASTAAVQ